MKFFWVFVLLSFEFPSRVKKSPADKLESSRLPNIRLGVFVFKNSKKVSEGRLHRNQLVKSQGEKCRCIFRSFLELKSMIDRENESSLSRTHSLQTENASFLENAPN